MFFLSFLLEQLKTYDGLKMWSRGKDRKEVWCGLRRHAAAPYATIDMNLRQCCGGFTDGEDSGTGQMQAPSGT